MSTEAEPTGTVTFLFTDIESSTRLWELHPELMQSILARHDLIVRGAVTANHGWIVKTTGDGFHAVFETALSAIQAALTAQQALCNDTWREIQPQTLRVRMGVHTGEAKARSGDYYGPAVNRAARLMSSGYGGQVLVSATTGDLVRDLLPADVLLLDLGEHRLKDLIRPEHIFQLVHPALPSSFPPLKSLDAYPNNLPIQITSFIGREREIEEVKRLLSTGRLVTLTGSGGTGKTRLALQVAAEAQPLFTDGVWLVELASLADPDFVLQTIASALELRVVPGIPFINLVTDYLRGKNLLLLLDNCEHLVLACAQMADHLLRTCPAVKILASSREGLGISGEVTYHVPSLSLPVDENPTVDSISVSEAAQLFLERVTSFNPRFTLTESNAAAVVQICRRLDGIPLALELAAARLKVFTVEQIAARLDDRFRLLTGGSRIALPRQQTLRAMIDWSYDLLSEPERALLRQLSVFVGGWTFEAADAVCPDLNVLSLLEQLINKSLVVMEEEQGQARYHMLETIQQYAREKLIEAGEGVVTRDRHLSYFLQLTVDAEPELRSGDILGCCARLASDYDNIRAAIEWGQDQRPEDALILIGNLVFFWSFHAEDLLRISRWLKDLLAKVEIPPSGEGRSRRRIRARARGLTTAGTLCIMLSDVQGAITAFTESISLERELGDKLYLAFALGCWATMSIAIDMVTDASSAAEEALALMREIGDKRWLLAGLLTMGLVQNRLGNYTQTRILYEEIRQYRDYIYPLFFPTILGLGETARLQGQIDEARTYYLKGLEIARQLKSKHFIAAMESELAHLERRIGNLQQAKEAYRKLILAWKDIGQAGPIAHQLECLAFIAQHEKESKRAARLLGAAEALRESNHAPMWSRERVEYDGEVASLRAQIEAAAFTAAWTEGRAMSMDQAVQYAITPASAAEAVGEN